MSNIPDINTEDILKNVIKKLSNERIELTVQIESLEQISNALLRERDAAVERAETAEKELEKSKPLNPDEIVE